MLNRMIDPKSRLQHYCLADLGHNKRCSWALSKQISFRTNAFIIEKLCSGETGHEAAGLLCRGFTCRWIWITWRLLNPQNMVTRADCGIPHGPGLNRDKAKSWCLNCELNNSLSPWTQCQQLWWMRWYLWSPMGLSQGRRVCLWWGA